MTASEADAAARNAAARRKLIRPCPTCGRKMEIRFVRGYAVFQCVSVVCADGLGQR